jgi:hypothetical protein
LGCLNFSNDRRITIQDSSLVNHPIQGVVESQGWARIKRGDEQNFCVTTKIGHYAHTDSLDWKVSLSFFVESAPQLRFGRNARGRQNLSLFLDSWSKA